MRLTRGLARLLLSVFLAALLSVVQLPCHWAGAELTAPSEQPEEAASGLRAAEKPVTTLFLNSHEQETLQPGDVLRYRFTPESDDLYIFRSFPGDTEEIPAAAVRLFRTDSGETLEASEQSGVFTFICSLEAGCEYELEITARSAGSLAVEVMLDARGRCFDNAIALPEGSVRYAKTIVRARDVHWFSFTAAVSGWYSIRTEQSGDSVLDTRGLIMDDSGRLLASNDDILFPGDANFMIQCELTAGETYYLRISAFSNMTGPYRLVMTAPEEGQVLPEQVTLSRHDLMMDVDGEFTLTAELKPKNALPGLTYASSNSNIVSVEPHGTVRAVSAGQATVWVMSYGEVKDRCVVTVRPVEVTGMEFEMDQITIRAEEQATVRPVFYPVNASNQTARYQSSDPSVASVTQSGVVTGVSEGDAVITAMSADGSFADTISVHVDGVRPVYRALVLGEQKYETDPRVGGENTAQGVADMLKSQTIEGFSYSVRLQLDSTRAEVLSGIAETFAGAKETDISLFYINCHGAYENGVAYLRLHDESRMTVSQLEAALSTIPGKVIVILDFCQSGAFIGAGGEFERFTGQTKAVFAGGTALTTGKYTVIASASADEDSYRRAFSSGPQEQSTAAIMGKSLCEGAGWDLIYDRSVALKADADRNRQITVQEIYEYTRKRVMHYLEGTGAAQTVHVYPEGDQTVIFGRN